MNGTIIGTLSEERIREICRQRLLDPVSEELVIKVMRKCDEEVDDPENDLNIIKEMIKSAPEANLIAWTIADITMEFFLKKKTVK